MSEEKLGDNNFWYGKQRNDETKKRISEANVGKIRGDETKQKISESKQGENNPMYGKKHNEESKQKNREAHIGKLKSEEHKQKISDSSIGEKNHNSKRVYQCDLEGTFIKSFESCGEAGRHLKKASSCISRCARGELKTAYKFKWSYVKI